MTREPWMRIGLRVGGEALKRAAPLPVRAPGAPSGRRDEAGG